MYVATTIFVLDQPKNMVGTIYNYSYIWIITIVLVRSIILLS